MESVRIVASLLIYPVRVLAVLIIVVLVYAAVSLILYNLNPGSSVPVEVQNGQYFIIFFPFTRQPFLLGDYTSSYIITHMVMLLFYSFFLWLLADVFHTFRQTKLFTQQGVGRLSRFYMTNLLLPVLSLLLLAFFGDVILDIVRVTMLHLVLGIFAFFMAAIFKQGLELQEEQDLTF